MQILHNNFKDQFENLKMNWSAENKTVRGGWRVTSNDIPSSTSPRDF